MHKAKFDFIRYSNCWEDTNNLLESLDIENNIGLSVLSAGDNTFSLLLKNPKKIVAFDINKTQIYLFNLKKAGIENLEYEDLLCLLGISNINKSYDIFLTLEQYMDKESFEYFKKHPEFFKKGIVNIGKFEKYFQVFVKWILPLFSSKKRIKKLASFKNVKEQEEYYNKVINNKRLRCIFNIFFGFKVMGRLGRDKNFYNYVENKEESGKNIKKIFDYGITHIANYDNPYINYVLTNSFKEYCMPLYLKKENFNIIKDRIDRIEVINSNLEQIEGKYDFYNLSDIFEYMDENEFKNNIEKLKGLSNNNASIAYYNMQNKRYISESGFEYLEKISKELTLKTKSYFYRDFLVYKWGTINEHNSK